MTETTSRQVRRISSRKPTPLYPAKTTIVCGTDFSEQAEQAVDAAAALATRLKEPLVLVHAVDKDTRTTLPADLRESLCLFERARLRDELECLHERKVEVIEHFQIGKADAVLIEAVAAQHARLLVVSSHGRKAPERWVLGSVAERAAEGCPIPTLVVRAAAPITGWAIGKRRLRVLVGADFSAPSEAALRWVAWLKQLGSCDTVVTYLEPTLPANAPFAMFPSPVVTEMLNRIEQVQARSFRQRVRTLLGTSCVRVRIEKGWERSDAHLIEIARKERVDLIVVGTHQRHGLGRVGHISVSRGVLHYAPMSVACVPLGAGLEQTLL